MFIAGPRDYKGWDMSFNIEHLISRQVRKWQEDSRATKEAPREETKAPHKPMICISREYGARGAVLGKMIADKLGFQFYSRDIVKEIAGHAHIRKEIIDSLDERARMGVTDWIDQQFGNESFTNSEYLRYLCQVVLTLARHGKGVIVGRGAQFILSPDWTLRIRTCASVDVRTARIAERDGISRGEARERVLQMDSQRSTFHRQHFKQDTADPRHYDLVLNTGTIPEEACARLAVEAFRVRFGR